ncbi:MAG: DHH family phosphoesterase, partial [Fidelibacterota bacterium]
NCQYPFKELSGVGVSFKLIQALSGTLNMGTEPFKRYLDLVTIGTSADIVPLVDENRVMVSEGLRRIELTDNLGIQALMETSGIRNTEINVERIIFILAPRINAVGRLGDASKAVELLTTGDVTRAYSIARILEAENRKRRNLDVKTFKQAESELLRIYDKSKWRSAVLASESWHHGVIGIAAAKLVEKYFLPTILISIKDGIGRGSARSIPGFDIYRALQSCEGLLLNFGGHKYAAGLRIDPEAIPEFRHKFNELAFEIISEDLMTPTINIEAEISLNEINSTLLSLNRKLAPFGPSNTKPVFASRELQVVGNPHIVGDSHMKFKVRQNQIVHDVIGFDMAERLSGISKGTYIDMAYVIDENVWQGVKRVQLNTKDIKFN